MDLGRPIARHIARRPQECGDHAPPGDRPPVDVRVRTPDLAETEQPVSPDPAPVGRPTG